VTFAVYLLYAYAILQLVGAIVLFATYGDFKAAYQEAYRGSSVENQASTIATVTVVVGAIVAVIVAAGVIILAFFDSKGKNPARIITWVLGGLAICCGAFGILGGALGGSMNFGGNTSGAPSASEVQRILRDQLPNWYYPVTIGLSVIELLALILAIILLALPASNAFFRKQPPQQAWEPPLPPVPGQ
jgi:hypothetical protein